MMDGMNRVAVLGGNRIPFARVNTAYRHASNQEMLTAALAGLAERFGLEGRRPGLVVGGAVVKQSRDFNLVRESVLGTALDPATPCIDLQQACATSLQAAFVVANEIALGRIDCGIACGVDSSSDPPIGINEELRRILLDFNRARDTGTKLRVLSRLRPRHIVPALPGIREPRTRKSMGEHAEISARVWQIDRAGQDRLALESHRRLAAAWDRGFFNDLVTPFLGLERDNVLRPDTSLEKLASLAPAFSRDGTITAGNASPLNDGASALVIGSATAADRIGADPLARVAGRGASALEPHMFGYAPVEAAERALRRAGITWSDVGAVELNEAFAVQSLACLDAWPIDPEIVNVKGGAIAIGHPLGASGGRILGTLAHVLRERRERWGVAAICIGVGQGLAVVLENVTAR